MADRAWMKAQGKKKKKKRKRRKRTKPSRSKYDAYMASEAWQKKRKRALARAGYECACCGSSDDLQVHHKTYVRLGKERDNDLLVLCKPCHRKAHGIEGAE